MDVQKMGRFIAETRKSKHLTQSQLGEKLGISGKAVSKWERGISAPDIGLLNELSKILEVNVTEILTGKKVNEYITKESASEMALSSIGAYSNFFKKKYIKTIIVLIFTILLLTFAFSSIYLISNYNKCFVYKLSSAKDDFYMEGIIAINQDENSLILTDILYGDQNKGTPQEIRVVQIETELLIGKYIIDSKKTGLANVPISEAVSDICIVINENPKIAKVKLNEMSKNGMTLNIYYVDEFDSRHKLVIPIKIEKRFSNNKLFY